MLMFLTLAYKYVDLYIMAGSVGLALSTSGSIVTYTLAFTLTSTWGAHTVCEGFSHFELKFASCLPFTAWSLHPIEHKLPVLRFVVHPKSC